MKKREMLQLLWYYLKDERGKVIVYIILVILSYLPVLITPYFWGKALEFLVIKDFSMFLTYLICLSVFFIIFYSILKIPM